MAARLYVYAIVRSNVRLPRIAGHRLERVELTGVAAAVERRMKARAPSHRALRDQYGVVTTLHECLDAILPVRFGALIEEDELRRVVRLRRSMFVSALRTVRRKSQMTVRFVGSPADVPAVRTPATGTDYLLSRVESSRPVVTPLAEGIRQAVAGLISAESFDRGRGSIQLTMNHLVRNGLVARYRSKIEGIMPGAASPSTVIVTGPLPPFAFVPDLLHDA